MWPRDVALAAAHGPGRDGSAPALNVQRRHTRFLAHDDADGLPVGWPTGLR